jgi:hypothetical protein
LFRAFSIWYRDSNDTVKGLPIPIKKFCQLNFKLASVRQLPLETLNFLPIAVTAEFFLKSALVLI